MDRPTEGSRPSEVIVAARERGVRLDRASLQRTECDLFGRRRRGHREHDGAIDPIGVVRRTTRARASRPSNRRSPRPTVDPEFVGEGDLDRDLVANGDDREPRAVRGAVGIGRRRPRRALTSAEHVGTDHEVAVGVEWRPGSDERRPTNRARRDQDPPDLRRANRPRARAAPGPRSIAQ